VEEPEESLVSEELGGASLMSKKHSIMGKCENCGLTRKDLKEVALAKCRESDCKGPIGDSEIPCLDHNPPPIAFHTHHEGDEAERLCAMCHYRKHKYGEARGALKFQAKLLERFLDTGEWVQEVGPGGHPNLDLES